MAGACPLQGSCLGVVREVVTSLQNLSSSPLFPLVPRQLGEVLLHLVTGLHEVLGRAGREVLEVRHCQGEGLEVQQGEEQVGQESNIEGGQEVEVEVEVQVEEVINEELKNIFEDKNWDLYDKDVPGKKVQIKEIVAVFNNTEDEIIDIQSSEQVTLENQILEELELEIPTISDKKHHDDLFGKSITLDSSKCHQTSNAQSCKPDQHIKSKNTDSLKLLGNFSIKDDIYKTVQCPQCTKVLSPQEMRGPNKHRHKKLVTCPLCGKKATSWNVKMRFKRHFELEHKEEAKGYFEMIEIEKTIQPKTIEWYSSGSFKKLERGLNGKLICPVCQKEFSRHFIRSHMKWLHIESNKTSDYMPKQECKDCGKRVCDLPRHMEQVHIRKRPHKCDKCEFICSDRHQLKKHVSMKHEGIRFTCEICGASVINIKQHEYIVHKRNLHKRHCDKCGKIFGMNRDLTKHIEAKHTGKMKRGESCILCNLRCKVLDMEKHLATVHAGVNLT